MIVSTWQHLRQRWRPLWDNPPILELRRQYARAYRKYPNITVLLTVWLGLGLYAVVVPLHRLVRVRGPLYYVRVLGFRSAPACAGVSPHDAEGAVPAICAVADLAHSTGGGCARGPTVSAHRTRRIPRNPSPGSGSPPRRSGPWYLCWRYWR